MNKLRLTFTLLILTCSSLTYSQEVKWKDFLDGVESELKSDDYLVRMDAIRTFDSQDNRDGVDFLIELMLKKKEHPSVRHVASEVVGDYKSEFAKKAVAGALRKQRVPNLYLLQAYISHGHEDALAVTINAIKNSKDNNTIATALNVLTSFEGPYDDRLIDLVASYLEVKNYHSVRRSAATVLGNIPSKLSFEPLVANLEDLVIADTVRDSLLRLTGQEFWRSKSDWEDWWKDNKETFSPKLLDDDTFSKKREKLREKHGEDLAADFYEREFTGKNIVFLLDVSGSMGNEAGESTRIEVLKEELSNLLGSLDERFSIGLVLFPHGEFPKRGIDKVDNRFRKSAEKFLKGIKNDGGTPMWGAIEHTFKHLVEDENIDTIYLLSDGSPTDSTGPEIIKKVLELNEAFGVKFNTVSIGSKSKTLKQLAEDSGGDYWEIQ